MSGRYPSEISPNAETIRDSLISATNNFLELHRLRLKVRKLPIIPDQTENECQQEHDGDAPPHPSETRTQFPLYHFVTRQKRHMQEQLLRNRSSYLTEFNTVDDKRNSKSPFILRQIPNRVLENLNKMASDFDDPEFSGVWISIHTDPFSSELTQGAYSRSKIVGWALIELLTTNERCLKALWMHPKLTAQATTYLLRGFLPRVLLEAFELPKPSDSSCDWKFFYSWVDDFDSFPRPAWVILASKAFMGLPRHFDNLDTPVEPGHQDYALADEEYKKALENDTGPDSQISSANGMSQDNENTTPSSASTNEITDGFSAAKTEQIVPKFEKNDSDTNSGAENINVAPNTRVDSNSDDLAGQTNVVSAGASEMAHDGSRQGENGDDKDCAKLSAESSINSSISNCNKTSTSDIKDAKLIADSVRFLDSNCCGCYIGARWDKANQVLLGCTEQAMYRSLESGAWKEMIPTGQSKRLLEDSVALPEEDQEPYEEIAEDVETAETGGLSKKQLGHLIGYIWGTKLGGQRITGTDEYIIDFGRKRDDNGLESTSTGKKSKRKITNKGGKK